MLSGWLQRHVTRFRDLCRDAVLAVGGRAPDEDLLESILRRRFATGLTLLAGALLALCGIAREGTLLAQQGADWLKPLDPAWEPAARPERPIALGFINVRGAQAAFLCVHHDCPRPAGDAPAGLAEFAMAEHQHAVALAGVRRFIGAYLGGGEDPEPACPTFAAALRVRSLESQLAAAKNRGDAAKIKQLLSAYDDLMKDPPCRLAQNEVVITTLRTYGRWLELDAAHGRPRLARLLCGWLERLLDRAGASPLGDGAPGLGGLPLQESREVESALRELQMFLTDLGASNLKRAPVAKVLDQWTRANEIALSMRGKAALPQIVQLVTLLDEVGHDGGAAEIVEGRRAACRVLNAITLPGEEPFEELDRLAAHPPAELQRFARQVAVEWLARYRSALPYDTKIDVRGDGWVPFDVEDTYVTAGGKEYKLWDHPKVQFMRGRLVRMGVGIIEEMDYDKRVRPTRKVVAHACNLVFQAPLTPSRARHLPDELWKQYQVLAARYDEHRQRIEGQKASFLLEELERYFQNDEDARKLRRLIDAATRCKNLFPASPEGE